MTPDLSRIATGLMLCQATYDYAQIPQGDGWSAPRMFGPARDGFAIARAGKLYVYFAGTRGIDEWLSDGKCHPDANGIHSGVSEAFTAMMPGLVDAISYFPPMPIEFGGHSRGAAFAEVAAESMDGALDPVTFGGMRVFTEARANTIPFRGIRLVNEYDIVPHLPGRCGIWNYMHRAYAWRFKGPRCEPDSHHLATSYAMALVNPLEGPLELS